MLRLAAFGGLLLLVGCGALPAEGPSAGKLENTAMAAPQGPFPIISLDQQALTVLEKDRPKGLSVFSGNAYNGSVLRPGDDVEVTIFDTGEAGLFSSADSKSLALGQFEIAKDGSLSLPFVGGVDAAGATPGQLQDRIVLGLRGKAVSPQASVRVVEQGSSGFTVNGDVNTPGRYKLTAQGEKVLDAIALAGGAKSPSGETEVTLIRGSKQSKQTLDKLVATPSENVFVRPGDQVYLRHDPPTYTAFGAVQKPGEYPFETGKLTLVQALAQVGGLNGEKANPKGVYIFRYETSVTAFGLGLKVDLKDERPVPLIYRLDTTKAASYFVMQSFLMRDGDILFASNSPFAQLDKFFEVIQKVPKPDVVLLIKP